MHAMLRMYADHYEYGGERHSDTATREQRRSTSTTVAAAAAVSTGQSSRGSRAAARSRSRSRSRSRDRHHSRSSTHRSSTESSASLYAEMSALRHQASKDRATMNDLRARTEGMEKQMLSAMHHQDNCIRDMQAYITGLEGTVSSATQLAQTATAALAEQKAPITSLAEELTRSISCIHARIGDVDTKCGRTLTLLETVQSQVNAHNGEIQESGAMICLLGEATKVLDAKVIANEHQRMKLEAVVRTKITGMNTQVTYKAECDKSIRGLLMDYSTKIMTNSKTALHEANKRMKKRFNLTGLLDHKEEDMQSGILPIPLPLPPPPPAPSASEMAARYFASPAANAVAAAVTKPAPAAPGC